MSAEEREAEVEDLEERFGGKLMAALRDRALAKSKDRGKAPVVLGAESTDQTGVSLKSAMKVHPLPQKNELSTPANIDALPVRFKLELESDNEESVDLSAVKHTAVEHSNTVKPQASSSTSHGGLSSIRFQPDGRPLQHKDSASSEPGGEYELDELVYLVNSGNISQRTQALRILSRIIERYMSLSGPGVDLASEEEAKLLKSAQRESRLLETSLELSIASLTSAGRNRGLASASIGLLYWVLGGDTRLHGTDAARKFDGFLSITTNDTAWEMPPDVTSLPWDQLAEPIGHIFAMPGFVPDVALAQLVRILSLASYTSTAIAELLAPIIVTALRQSLLLSDSEQDLDGLVMQLARTTVVSSRGAAEYISNSGVCPSLIRYLAVLPPSTDSSPRSAAFHVDCAHAVDVLRLYEALGRYGYQAALATEYDDVWRHLLSAFEPSITSEAAGDSMCGILAAFFDLRRIWIVCAMDPHRTTPDHSLTWAQISAMDWMDSTCRIIRTLNHAGSYSDAFASAIEAVVAWLEGGALNGVDHGQKDKQAVRNAIEGIDFNHLLRAAATATHIAAILAVIRLDSRLHFDANTQWLVSESTVLQILEEDRMITDRNLPPTISPSSSKWTIEAHNRTLRFELLQYSRRRGLVDSKRWLARALEVLPSFRVGDEPFALDLLDDILRSAVTDYLPAEHVKDLHRDGLQILRPLLQYHILPDVMTVAAPLYPSPLYLKVTTTLRPPATSSVSSTGKRMPGLPLPADWMFLALDELLHSADSAAIAQVTPDWDASELDVVRATLLLAELATAAGTEMPRSELLLNLMKVFMLEHDQQSARSTSASDAFRDPQAGASLERLITPLRIPAGEALRCPTTLEDVSRPFLGQETFFEFYTDFVSLYEAISFSHPIFTQLILPPLAMSYPSDFRRLLWVERPSCLRNIRTLISEVPLEHGSIDAYLDPPEQEQDILSGYARALTRGWVTTSQEFLWELATRHLAHLFWGSDDEQKGRHRTALLSAVVCSADDKVVRAVLESGHVDANHMKSRVGTVHRLVGERGSSRLTTLGYSL